ncbi:uncharacterized protein E0L32_005918 [Thyridium curvatum]|uniref:Thioester reductase (TE) domain-containing protein n=1 Tax=Thyridium curvatum TaxID=1093900 RepID=A0A507ASE6_9PEZI|nr:uncharacterized protein E0L32_005918 [Thyridium curvatum]TPX13715.1 hypothetical protein E0L32_005918 [Thyridium curvatum]
MGIPTTQGVVDVLKQTPADIAILVPSVVAELAQNLALPDYCAAHLQAILYIWGYLPQALEDRVAEKIYLRCLWGSSETAIVPQLLLPELLPSERSSRNLWRYIRFSPWTGAAFDRQTGNTYELVFGRDNVQIENQPCFAVRGSRRPNDTDYRTKDLFEPHPTIPDLWCWRARLDDIIVFLNSEKTNPVSVEHEIVASNPELSGVLVPLTTAEQATLTERVGPSVKRENQSAPAHARVEKSLILVGSPDRRFMPAGKGTLMRGPSISQYAEEIYVMYAAADMAEYEEEEAPEADFAAATRVLMNCDDDMQDKMETLEELLNTYRELIRKIPSFDAAELPKNGLDERVEFFQASLEQPSLGLSIDTYRRLGTYVGLIIHAAWPVNFNLPLSAFRPQFARLVNLLTFATSTDTITKFVFISSISAVEAYKDGPAPEAVLTGQPTVAASVGYARSNYLGEVLVGDAAHHLGARVLTTVIRLGQVRGPVLRPGLGNMREWFPSMILSSLHLEQVEVLADLALATGGDQPTEKCPLVFNIRNPQLTHWRDLIPAVVEAGGLVGWPEEYTNRSTSDMAG